MGANGLLAAGKGRRQDGHFSISAAAGETTRGDGRSELASHLESAPEPVEENKQLLGFVW